MIPEDTIARVRESVNLVELVRESVPGLKKTGRNFLARCPFHQEKTPSFNVNPELGLFKCFGCGVGGDAFKFVMLQEGLNYPEAIRKLAARVGVTIEEEAREAATAESKERQLLYGLLEDAAKFFHRHLMESSDGAVARAYLEKRGLTPRSLDAFCIGFAPASGTALRDAAARKGWSHEILEKAGLLKRREDAGRLHDHFWNRIVFPIWDVQGRIVAFGGRAMGEAIPKYINSPETPVYSKSRHLYGLFQGLASLRRDRHVVILEGYMDVVTCHQFGFETAVATLGTALTPDHVRLLRRYVDRITLLFDPDAAGAKAAIRGGALLAGDSFSVDVVTLPDALDVDDLLVQRGAVALEQYLKDAVPFMDYFMASAMSRHPRLTPESKLAVAREVLPVIRQMKDPLLQDEHLGRLADALRSDKAVLGQQMKRLKPEPVEDSRSGAAAPSEILRTDVRSLEDELLLIALQYPSAEVAERLDRASWSDSRHAAVWALIRGRVAEGAVPLADVLGHLPEATASWLTRLALEARQYAQPLAVLESLQAARERQRGARELEGIKQDIDAMIAGQAPMDEAKVRRYHDLSRKLKGGRLNG